MPESPRRAGRHRGPSDPSTIHLGELVETTSPRTRALVALESWSTIRILGPGPKRPGQLVDPAGTRTRARIARRIWSTPQALDPYRVARETGSTPRALSTGPNSPGPLVDHRVHRKLACDARGLLVDPSGPWTRAGVARDSWSTPRALGLEPESPGRVGRPRVHWSKRELPGTAVPHRHTLGTFRSSPGKLVDTVGLRALP